MEIEEFKNFINNPTSTRKEWLNGINLLYTGNSQTNVRETKSKINKIIKSNKNEELARWDFRNYNHWKNCVEGDVIKYKEKYLEALLKVKEPIKYIIFSEAPKLTWKSSENPSSAYLFGNKPVSGNYKSAPLKAFNSNQPIIKTFAQHRVAFIDLMDLPLPIDGNLRKEWNYIFEIDGNPLSVFLLENAIENFIQKSNCISKKKNLYKIQFDSDIYFAFMMPPKTSMGIIEHYFKKNKSINITIDDVNVYLPNERIIQCNNIYTKIFKSELIQEILPLYSRVAMSGSNTPSDLLLKHALNIII
jgi:hypothetical protein